MRRSTLFVAGLWLVTVGTALAGRPAWPPDETRYLGVAWDMWARGDLLLPRLNGLPYTDKPPLLFWLMHAGWATFGVNSWWPRLLPPLFALLSLHLTARLARALWPQRPDAAGLAPVLLAGAILWTAWSTLLMFDMLAVAFTLLALLMLLRALAGGGVRAWLLMGGALGLGLLAKGPVLLLHVLPVALLSPLWSRPGSRPGSGSVLAGTTLALLVAVAIALAWVVPASMAGGPAFRDAILFGQIGKRLAPGGLRLHDQPLWYYAAVLPVALFPWPFWPRLWRAAAGVLRGPADDGLRCCACWAAASLLLMSAVASKQEQYLLPMLPALALLGARALADAPSSGRRGEAVLPGLALVAAGVLLLLARAGRLGVDDPALRNITPLAAWLLGAAGLGLALASLGPVPRAAGLLATASAALVVVAHVGVLDGWSQRIDPRPAALALSAAQRAGRPTAFVGEYRAEYQFAGRLRAPVEPLDRAEVATWVARHPDGVLVDRRRLNDVTAGLDPEARFEDDILLWSAAALAPRLTPEAQAPDPR